MSLSSEGEIGKRGMQLCNLFSLGHDERLNPEIAMSKLFSMGRPRWTSHSFDERAPILRDIGDRGQGQSTINSRPQFFNLFVAIGGIYFSNLYLPLLPFCRRRHTCIEIFVQHDRWQFFVSHSKSSSLTGTLLLIKLDPSNR